MLGWLLLFHVFIEANDFFTYISISNMKDILRIFVLDLHLNYEFSFRK